MYLIDFSECLKNQKAYGGRSGSKWGIINQGEDWMLKFPKRIKGVSGAERRYTSSPLSEYLGSQIYEILGYPVHETRLGIAEHRLVVACKDFTFPNVELQEYRKIRNYYSKELVTALKDVAAESSAVSTSIEEVKVHLKCNRLLNAADGIAERFWDCMIIDILINNRVRNIGDWGTLLYGDGSVKAAPVFDNGNSFSVKLSDEEIKSLLHDEKSLVENAVNTITGYSFHGKNLSIKELLRLEDEDNVSAVSRVVPLIQAHMDDIRKLIYEMPESENGIEIISKARKEFYVKGMEIRMQQLLVPALEHAQTLTEKEEMVQIAE